MREIVSQDSTQLAAWYHRLGRLSLQEGDTESAVDAYAQALAAGDSGDSILTAQINAELRAAV